MRVSRYPESRCKAAEKAGNRRRLAGVDRQNHGNLRQVRIDSMDPEWSSDELSRPIFSFESRNIEPGIPNKNLWFDLVLRLESRPDVNF